MLKAVVLNHIEYVNLGPKHFRESNRIDCRVGSSHSKVRGEENSSKGKGL
jgi:hypothetical protein